MAVKTYRKTALVTAEQFLPSVRQIPAGVYSSALGAPNKRPDAEWVLDTKEGRHTVRNGDYICTGPNGEKWNVERKIFEDTYEEVREPSPQPPEVDPAEVIAVLEPFARLYAENMRPIFFAMVTAESTLAAHALHAKLTGGENG